MKIITVSEPECGDKPTGYMAVIPDENFDTLKKHIFKGLEIGWGIHDTEADGMLSDEDIYSLRSYTYVWFGKDFRFLVEITETHEEEEG